MKHLWLKFRRAIGVPRQNLFAVEMTCGTMFNVDARTVLRFPSWEQKYKIRAMTDAEMDENA